MHVLMYYDRKPSPLLLASSSSSPPPGEALSSSSRPSPPPLLLSSSSPPLLLSSSSRPSPPPLLLQALSSRPSPPPLLLLLLSPPPPTFAGASGDESGRLSQVVVDLDVGPEHDESFDELHVVHLQRHRSPWLPRSRAERRASTDSLAATTSPSWRGAAPCSHPGP